MNDSKITIDTVSKMAGVSKATVSRYLNKKYEHMSEQTRLHIKDIIEDLGYRPNIIARNLKTKTTKLIGVIVSDITNPVTVHLIKGVMSYCAKQGYQVITASSDESLEKEREYILSMVDRQVDGLIINVIDYNEYGLLDTLKQDGVNIVLADRTINKALFDTVTTDNYSASKMLVEKLYSMGYDTVALFSSDLLKSNVRLSRYKAFLAESRFHTTSDPLRTTYIFQNDLEDEYKAALQDFIANTPNKRRAVFASTPMALLNLVNAAYELHLNIPEDLGVCGYDNLTWTKLIGGGITVVEQPFFDVGAESANLLLRRINSELTGPPKYIELKSKLILRNSTQIKS
ncbi:MAG: LacI family transcriptional regulator [Defluviitaleaceae bacterium]|nr:LacI family transcriptional regulator [Defluviitaleaceae bacterium]